MSLQHENPLDGPSSTSNEAAAVSQRENPPDGPISTSNEGVAAQTITRNTVYISMEFIYNIYSPGDPLDEFRIVGVYSSLTLANAATERYFRKALAEEELESSDIESEDDEEDEDEKAGFEETTEGWFTYDATYAIAKGVRCLNYARTKLKEYPDGVKMVFYEFGDGEKCILSVEKHVVE
ncbi:hypothetical protein K440DRAFT_664133 [Wilcoxina mikolae CBS 423.85]|nr:hypothetical protein K440DRAFT_664133 [Wilcoxina mikolae CBS 423.85]